MIERDELCAMIPHDGCMCLLNRVLQWDDNAIICQADSHRDGQNPLRDDEGLSSVSAIEYAAQAMAVHGSLTSRNVVTVGHTLYLAAAREVEFRVDWLHDIPHPLTIQAERLMADAAGMIYRFTLHAASKLLVQGRVTVMLSSNRGQGA